MIKKLTVLLWGTVTTLAVLSACQSTTPPPSPVPISQPTIPADLPPLDPQRVAQGKELYSRYCAACHGPNGEGQPNWQVPNQDGTFNAPPHDNTGHTWHHDDELLVGIVANGSSMPQSQMPAFGDQLSEEEIRAILEYIKSWWGPEQRTFQWQVTQTVRQQNEEQKE